MLNLEIIPKLHSVVLSAHLIALPRVFPLSVWATFKFEFQIPPQNYTPLSIALIVLALSDFPGPIVLYIAGVITLNEHVISS